MKRVVLYGLALIILGALGYAAYRLLDERKFASTPYGEGTRVVEIPPGTGPRQLARLLAQKGVVADEARFYTHLHYFRRNAKTRAGEYEFDGPQLPDEVLGKLIRGEVKLYRFTVPEGLRVDEIAPIIGETGLCDGGQFLQIARDPASAKKYGVSGKTLEGYLFPDTYTVTKGVGCNGIVQAMVAGYKRAWAIAEQQRDPRVKLTPVEGLTLASIVEKETARAEERPRVSCVFHNRLKKGWPLGTDPTVIYAILVDQNWTWDGNIHKSDLSRDSPYNTYKNKGLPPGPISNPGLEAMKAALHPLDCDDMFFVSRNDGTHVFCPTLSCHEAAVQKWQVEFFKNRKKG